jgi:hypothetical protein
MQSGNKNLMQTIFKVSIQPAASYLGSGHYLWGGGRGGKWGGDEVLPL